MPFPHEGLRPIVEWLFDRGWHETDGLKHVSP
jgi:hypothetical protein